MKTVLIFTLLILRKRVRFVKRICITIWLRLQKAVLSYFIDFKIGLCNSYVA